MTSVAETGILPEENSKFTKEFEEYRRACQAKYQQRSQPVIEEEKEEEDVCPSSEDLGASAGINEAEMNVDASKDPLPSPATTPASPTAITSPIQNCASPSPSVNDSKLNSSVEMLKISGQTQRRGSLGKVMSFCSNVFSKKTSSPSLSSYAGATASPSLPSLNKEMRKEKERMERAKAEQDWRMARFIAELEYDGKTDEEIQTHLFHIRDQAQFARPRSNSIGELFRGMHQAFKDEFSARRDRQCATVHVSTVNPFTAAAPANYVHDMGYSYEDLVALESVPRGIKSLDHLPILVFEGQELPSNQTTCAICMQEFETSEELRSLQCLHHYHKECVDKWLGVATACPVCKGEVLSEECH